MQGKLVELPPVVVPQGLDDEGPFAEVVVPEYFPPGSIMVFETHLQGMDPTLDAFCSSGADEAFGDLDLVDLNVVLYRAEGEERDATKGVMCAGTSRTRWVVLDVRTAITSSMSLFASRA